MYHRIAYIFTVDNLQPPGDSIDGEIKTGLNEDTLSSSVDLSIASGEEHCQCCRHLNCSEVVLSWAWTSQRNWSFSASSTLQSHEVEEALTSPPNNVLDVSCLISCKSEVTFEYLKNALRKVGNKCILNLFWLLFSNATVQYSVEETWAALDRYQQRSSSHNWQNICWNRWVIQIARTNLGLI